MKSTDQEATMTTMSEKHGYPSIRTDAEWHYLFTTATIAEVRQVAEEIEAAAVTDPDPTHKNLRRDLQRVTKARLNAGQRAVDKA